jgi:4-amino-4-deoxy-L-arabinose transferase-like glycosyltransferase
VVALGVRVAYVLISRRNFVPGGDALFYHAGANLLADGKGFISPFFPASQHVQAAEHPPLYLIFLAIPSLLGMKSVLAHLLWSCVLGTGTVVVVALLARHVAGERAGLLAAVIAALSPNLWAPDGMLEAETLAMLLATVAVLFAYHAWRQPTVKRLAAVGATCGAAALTRSELVLLLPLLVVPLAGFAREQSRRARLGLAGAGLVAAAAVIAPWSIYNATRFAHPIVLSAQIDPLLASANCDTTYDGWLLGYFDIECALEISLAPGFPANADESQQGIVYRRAAVRYVRGHLSRVPFVEGVRLLRLVGLYHPSKYVHMDNFIEGRDPLWVSWAGLYAFYAVALGAIAGVVVLRRGRGPPLFPLLAPGAAVVLTVLVTYASTRFRAAAEPSLVVLAAVALARTDRVFPAGGRRAALTSGR